MLIKSQRYKSVYIKTTTIPKEHCNSYCALKSALHTRQCHFVEFNSDASALLSGQFCINLAAIVQCFVPDNKCDWHPLHCSDHRGS